MPGDEHFLPRSTALTDLVFRVAKGRLNRFKVFGADDQGLVAKIVLEHPRQRGGHHGLAKSDHVTNEHTAAAMQVTRSDLNGALLELEQLMLKARRQPELAQASTRFRTEVIRQVQIDLVGGTSVSLA